MKRKDALRDIYQTNTKDFEKDFTPQVAQETMNQRQKDLRRSQLFSLLLGGVAITLAVALVAIVAQNLREKDSAAKAVSQADAPYTPQFSLSSEAAWVIAYKQADNSAMGLNEDEPGKKPLSAQWVQKAAYHLIMGQQALSVGHKDEALDHFNQVVKIYPEIEGVRSVMGSLCIENAQYAEAIEHLKKALAEDETFETVNNLGTACIGTKDYEAAEKYLKRALELQPESPASYKNLAILYRDIDRPDEASFHFEKYLDLRPDDIDTMQSYALFLTQQGRWKTAAEYLETLTEEVTDVAPIYFLLAQVQVQNGEDEKALNSMKRGIQLVDPNLALAWMSRNEFNDLRETEDFKKLKDELEIATVSLNGIE
jgi:tetratricopeptide (TPR) repeat protein